MATLLSKLTNSEKEKFCEYTYNNYISYNADILSEYEDIAQLLGGDLPSACYTNFRDSLFHFRKMVHTSDSSELEQNAYAVKEHANRAKTDAMLTVVLLCADIIQCMLSIVNNTELKAELSELLCTIRNEAMVKRLDGMMLEGTRLSQSDEYIINLMHKGLDVIQASEKEAFIESRKKIIEKRKH